MNAATHAVYTMSMSSLPVQNLEGKIGED